MWLRSEAQDEQTTQHGESGADETHSRQDECKTCSDTHEVHHLPTATSSPTSCFTAREFF